MSKNTNINSTALLVIDMQAPFLNVMEKATEVTKRTAFAMEAAELLGVPVALTEQVPDKLGQTIPELLNLVESKENFPKTAFSSLGAEGIAEWIKEKGIRNLIITGIETPVCVYQTTLQALREDMSVTLLSDCLTGRRLEDCEEILKFLRAGTNAAILPSETVFYSLLGSASHPNFREFTKLVKKYGS